MKILYLATVRLPTEKAHGLQIMKTCEALAAEGAQVTLLVPNRKSFVDDPFSYYTVAKNFELKKLGVPDLVRWGVVGFALTVVFFSEVAKWSKEFWAADYIYSRDALVLLQYILLGRKCVFEAHRNPTVADQLAALHAYRVVVINAALKARFESIGVAAQKIVVAHDAVDPIATKKTKHDLGVSEALPLVVYAGSQTAEKGFDTFEKAATILDSHEMTIYTVYRKSPLAARETLAAADIVVVPNSAKFESGARYTSPMKLFEALSSGAAVVASDVPAIREVVDERSVWFFTPDDAESLAMVIRFALQDPEREQKIAHAKSIAARYSWQARAQTVLSFLSA